MPATFIERQRTASLSSGVLERLRTLSPSTLGHVRDFGFVKGLTPITRPMRLVGPAVTVRIPHLDSTAVHCVLDVAEPGDVVVINQSGDDSRACWGGAVSYAAVKRGIAGAVVAGGLTDYTEVVDLQIPVYYRSITALTTRILGIEGAINVPISVGGVVVNPGDIVFGDENGVAILGPHEASAIAELLAAKEAAEVELKSKLDAGESLASLSSARALFGPETHNIERGNR